jgi:hypothetical protein
VCVCLYKYIELLWEEDKCEVKIWKFCNIAVKDYVLTVRTFDCLVLGCEEVVEKERVGNC